LSSGRSSTPSQDRPSSPTPDWTVRQSAVVKMGNGGDAGSLPALTEALAKEKDRWVRYALEEAIALIS